eukprot:m.192283 g.192283  ORF g.192283 m.192283 type:complete len:114 (-) comp18265_c0_seq2:346-687(-)
MVYVLLNVSGVVCWPACAEFAAGNPRHRSNYTCLVGEAWPGAIADTEAAIADKLAHHLPPGSVFLYDRGIPCGDAFLAEGVRLMYTQDGGPWTRGLFLMQMAAQTGNWLWQGS